MSEQTEQERETQMETAKHIERVQFFVHIFSDLIIQIVKNHDYSKFGDEEFQFFVKYTPKLKGSTYGSDEYKQFLKEMQPAIDHHYKVNRHHTEHFANGIAGMNLLDLVEMFCDWMAAIERHADGDIYKSIEINKKRFGFDSILESIFKNTAKVFLKEKEKN